MFGAVPGDRRVEGLGVLGSGQFDAAGHQVDPPDALTLQISHIQAVLAIPAPPGNPQTPHAGGIGSPAALLERIGPAGVPAWDRAWDTDCVRAGR